VPEHPESEAVAITPPLMWRTPDRTTPVIDYDYRSLAIRVDTRGIARPGGTLRFSDPVPLPPDHGAPLRPVIPFRYGNRSITAIQEMIFSTPGLPTASLSG